MFKPGDILESRHFTGPILIVLAVTTDVYHLQYTSRVSLLMGKQIRDKAYSEYNYNIYSEAFRE